MEWIVRSAVDERSRYANRDTATSPQVHGSQPSGPNHRILLAGVRWATSESLLAEVLSDSSTRRDRVDKHAAYTALESLEA
jgi:hypothetical protein